MANRGSPHLLCRRDLCDRARGAAADVPRTLVCRLRHRDISYRVLVDAHRRRRAVELLRQPGLTVAEIAERLGYEAPTNFGRACRLVRHLAAGPTAPASGEPS